MHRRLSSSPLTTIASRHHYHTSQSVKPTKKPNIHEQTTIHKVTRKPWEEVPFLTDLKQTEETEEALSLFHHYQQMGFRHDYPSYSSLIYKLAKSRDFDAVDQILLLVHHRNVRCRESLFIGLIQHYGKANSIDKAVDVFHKMTSFDCVRTIQSLNTLINVLVDSNELEKAKTFVDGAKDMGLRPNSVSFNVLIKGFLEKCDWEGARKVFDEMLEREVQPTVVTYNSLIGFLCRSNDVGEAKSLLEDMMVKRIRPNHVTFALLMKGLCCKGEYNEAKKLMFDMEYRGCKPGLVNYGVLMSDLGKRGKIDEARLLLNEMKKRRIKPDVVIYNILVNHLCSEGRASEAYRTLMEMQMKGCKPNAATYRMMVDGFCRIGDFDSALSILNAMLASRHAPTPATFVCLVDGLVKGGNLDHACFVLEVMGKKNLSFGSGAWEKLVNGLCIKDGGGCCCKILFLFVLSLAITFVSPARLLNEEEDIGLVPVPTTTSGSGLFPTSTGITTGASPASGGSGPLNTLSGSGPLPTTGSGSLPVASSVPLPATVPGSLPTTGSGPVPVASSGPLPAAGSGPLPTAGSGAGGLLPDHTLVFFMHDILGGSNPTARAVTGVVANAALSGQLPFAKPNGANLPVSNGVPSNSNNNGILNNNNVPLLVGLGGTTSSILQNNGNSLLNGLPVANGGQLPSGSSLQMLMFGTMTVMDNELTEGHELGSGLLGKAQGFYVASAVDGTSQTMAFTAMFESGGYEDSISFFGVHRTAASESHLGVMGGTGKYVNARGYAVVKTYTGGSGNTQQPHQFTDGLETVLECTVYLSY
ncbi:hypothetical protein HID58_031157 [Brassica napus]|uniref:Dirigent protein n=2 Tax=Brassica TaxID=3705 RepID=A0A8D9M6E9_BRACM|nr:hypothetical protein HID58_031157 [Brassica napus]CAF2260978.1 unnamed protein product [Brassica napus]CAG7900131.1 unnamed protein product [Brassica rapa]